MSRKPQPLEDVRWMLRETIQPNDYNPNKMPIPEFRLLKTSILEDGWTQPIVLYETESGERHIIDGEHRWTVSADPEVAALTDGEVPVVILKGDRTDRMMSTIRHNRARGVHGVVPMSEIVKELLEQDVPADEIMGRLGMEKEEVVRLAEKAGLPAVVSRTKEDFSKGWMPG